MPSYRTISRRRVLTAATGAGVMVLLAACSQAAPASPTAASSPPTAAAGAAPTTAPASQPTAAPTSAPAAAASPAATNKAQIQVATRGGSDGQIMITTAQAFTKQTGIPVKPVSYGPEPEYESKELALYATKQVADVVWDSSCCILGLANRGVLKDLDPIIKADNYDMTDYLPNAISSLTLQGKLYGMPWGVHPGNGGLLYNVKMLNDAGFTKVTEDPTTVLDWTYDTLMQAAQKTTKQSNGRVDVYGYLPGTDYLSLTNVVGAYGGDFLSSDGTKLTMDTKEFMQGMQWVYDVFVTNKVAPAPNASGDQLFDSQKLAMEASGYWGQFQPGIKDNTMQWNDSLQPTGPTGKRGSHLTINGQCMAASTTQPDEAWQFIKFLMSPEQNVQIVLSDGGRPAARKSVLNNPVLMQKMKSHKVWVQAIEQAQPWLEPANFRWEEFNTTIQQAFADAWVGKKTLEQVLPQAKQLLQAVLDKPPGI
jgi:multiple sugar transport system substrate-binding protein